MQAMLEQAQKVQQEIERVKQQAKEMTVTEESGGGMVRITMNGAQEVTQIKISGEIVNPNDIEMLEDLIVAAFNKATHASQELMNAEMNKVTGMLPNIPGLNF